MWCRFLKDEHKNDNTQIAYCSQTGYPCVCLNSSEEDVDKCYKLRSLCGFLAPDGTYYPCEPYAHMDEAERICKTILGVNLRNIEAERYLQMKSWVCLYARTIGFLATGYLPIYKGDDERKFIRLLSDKQIKFLEAAMKFCPIEDKYNDINGILEEDYHLKNDPVYRKLTEDTLL